MLPPFDLIEKYFEGNLSPEQEAELADWLGADREHLRIFLREVHLSQGMRNLSLNFQGEPGKELRDEEVAGKPEASLTVRDTVVLLANYWRQFALGGLCAVLLGLSLWLIFAPSTLFMASTGGVLLRRGGSEQMVQGRVKLHSGDIITTESSARAVLQYEWEGTQLEIGSGSSVEVHQAGRTKLLRLNAGTLYATVARQRFGRHLEFFTPQGHGTILGTDLKLFCQHDRTELEVYSGKVFLAPSNSNNGIQVNAGYAGVLSVGHEISRVRIPPALGFILWEYWLGIPGASIPDLTSDSRFAADPDSQSPRDSFEAPPSLDDNYGARARGYLHPPRTGIYHFWIAGDDATELWLSADDEPAVKQRICYTSAFTVSEQWEKSPTQKSGPIHLVAGRKYYIEALLKQAGGSSGLAVAWKGPDIDRQIIPGRYLSPLPGQGGMAPLSHQ